MLGLKLPTDPRWVNLAEKSLTEIFTDHAFCEQKAASTCISFIQLFPDKTELVEKLAPLVTEEWGHFRMVLHEMKKRNLTLGKQRKDDYVRQLLEFQKKGGPREDKLLENLLTAALIEARSCERFRVLSTQLEDEELRKFYHEFMVAEAGHYRLFIDLARLYFPKEKVENRWKAYLEKEAEIIESLELRGDRVH